MYNIILILTGKIPVNMNPVNYDNQFSVHELNAKTSVVFFFFFYSFFHFVKCLQLEDFIQKHDCSTPKTHAAFLVYLNLAEGERN